MTGNFVAVPAEKPAIEELSALLPANPFATPGFFDSRRQVGYSVWVLGLRGGAGDLGCGCGAFLRAGRLSRTLEIASLPPVGADSPFWEGLRGFCREQRVTVLQLDSFGSQAGAQIPDLGGRCERRSRREFLLDLGGDLVARLGSNHKRNVKKAQKAGLAVERTGSADAVGVHQSLMGKSMERRRSRGEDVRQVGPSLEDEALLRSDAGELFQAVRSGEVLSSVLVLRAPRGGYYHSAGTSPEGMEVGASHFLIHGIAGELKAAGCQVLNLGGADEESSLERFKLGFGAAPLPLPAATFYVGPAWRRVASGAMDLLRRATGR